MISKGESTREVFKSSPRNQRSGADRKQSDGARSGFNRNQDGRRNDRSSDKRSDSRTSFFKKKKKPGQARAA